MDSEKLLEVIKERFPTQFEEIKKAYDFAKAAHEGQRRISGEEYIIHPCAVAEILLVFGIVDHYMLIAAFLHDVLEDTETTAEEIKKEFGDKILMIVEGLTKLSKIKYNNNEATKAENIRKIFFAMAKDVRVILIKLADRVHNMRTLDVRTHEKQIETALETLEIYAGLAGRLGISFFKCELEDLAMKYLYPEDYKFIGDYVREIKEKHSFALEAVSGEIKEKFKEYKIDGEVSGRYKHLYSIYKKLKKNKDIKDIAQIYDLIAVRVIVPDNETCYHMLGVVHGMWKPIPDRIKDYIVVPKENGYQSLHTTVMTEFNLTFEIQIRTFEMHKIDEYGVAAHWKYKEGTLGDESELDDTVRWIREVLDTQRDTAPEEFLDSLKIDLKDHVFVFTPKGDVYDLPEGSTIIDFAYAIHSQVGNKCVGGRINKKMSTISTKLNTGDIVEILTSNSSKGPSSDWLKIAKTNAARVKIKQFFKKEHRDVNIARGRNMLEHEAKRRGYALSELFSEQYLDYMSNRQRLPSADDILAAVGYGELTTNQVILKASEYCKPAEPPPVQEIVPPKKSAAKKSTGGVLIKGSDGFSVKLAHCCKPVPGDPIVGYLSRGHGVTAHKSDCPNLKGFEAERLIEASWDIKGSGTYTASFNIVAENRTGILAEVTAVISNRKISIVGANINTNTVDGTVIMNISVEIHNAEELADLLVKIRASFREIIEIRR